MPPFTKKTHKKTEGHATYFAREGLQCGSGHFRIGHLLVLRVRSSVPRVRFKAELMTYYGHRSREVLGV